MRRIILWLFPFFVLGIIIQNTHNSFLVGAVLTALFFTVFIKKLPIIGIFIIIFVLLGSIASSIKTKEFDNKYLYLKSLNSYEGYIIDQSQSSYTIKNYSEHYKVILYLYHKTIAKPGDFIIFSGKLSDRPRYRQITMNSTGINAYISDSNTSIKTLKANSIIMLPVKFKYRLIDGLTSINTEGGTFISGLITGYTDKLTLDTKTSFMDLGLTHIIAVSGFNLGIIYYFVIIIAQKLNSRTKYILAFIICFLYTAISGFEPSITRAFIMLSLVIVSKLSNRFYDNLSGITLTAFTMLIINTYYIYNLGFLLSFSATYGIILLNKDIEDKLPLYIRHARGELSIGISAFISTLPIILWLKGYFSLITIIINVLISPLVSILTILSFFMGFLYLITSIKLILYPIIFLGIMFVSLVKLCNTINIMIYPGNPGIPFILMYYLLLGYFFEFIPLNLKPHVRKIVLTAGCILMLFLLLYHLPYLKVHFINVGQGESIFVETPQHRGILIDTGPKRQDFSAVKSIVLPYIRRLGYNSIDILILTHFHSDHAGDYQYFLDNFKVQKAIAFKTPTDSKYKFTELRSGDKVVDGSLTIDILAPDKTAKFDDDLNETCLVMNFHYKDFSMLLTGDAEVGVMDKMIGTYDVFNVSHHGSIKSFSKKMIDGSKIGIAVISVGKNNFGHPSPIVINYLSTHGIPVYRTDKDGNITVMSNGESYQTLFQ